MRLDENCTLSASAHWPLPWNVEAGLGAGVASELPIFHRDIAIVGERATPFMPVASIEYRPTRALALEAKLRLLMGETMVRYDTDYRGIPSRSPSSGTSWFAEVKLRVGH